MPADPDPVPAIEGLPEGWQAILLETVDSTNAEALRRIAGGAGAGALVVADRQSAGRGRRGAAWVSSPGNLFMTIVVEAPEGRAVGDLAFVAGLAAARAIEAIGKIGVRLKWPNDVMVDGRKLGGILIEGSRLASLHVVGLGINLVGAPSGTAIRAVSLHELGVAADRNRLAAMVCREFESGFREWRETGFSAVRTAWLDRAQGLGQRMTARLADGSELTGVFRDIDETGALVLEREDKSLQTVTAGAVFFGEG